MYQLPNETPQEFLVRALECREKIILCSQEDKSSVKYDPRLIQSLFLRTVETGLRDESIGIKLRTFLRDEKISDEKLLLELNIAACEETERQANLPPPQKKNKRVSSKISSVETASSEFSHKSKKERKQENDLAATVQFLQASVATLTRAVND